MNEVIAKEKQKNYFQLINILSLVIPVAVAVILSPGIPKLNLGKWTDSLTFINAIINSLTAILLCLGLVFIKQKNIQAHRAMMTTAFALGTFFLLSYVTYHLTHTSVSFPKESPLRPVYLFLLISHIVLSVVVVRFVLMALYFALTRQFDRHKKTVRWAYPIWLYVSVTGVVVYLMISPYYV
jgi:putative membrane protein